MEEARNINNWITDFYCLVDGAPELLARMPSSLMDAIQLKQLSLTKIMKPRKIKHCDVCGGGTRKPFYTQHQCGHVIHIKGCSKGENCIVCEEAIRKNYFTEEDSPPPLPLVYNGSSDSDSSTMTEGRMRPRFREMSPQEVELYNVFSPRSQLFNDM